MNDKLLNTRQFAEVPDAVIAALVSLSKATQVSQAVHLKDLKAVLMALQGRPGFTAIESHRQHSTLEDQHLPSKCQILAGPNLCLCAVRFANLLTRMTSCDMLRSLHQDVIIKLGVANMHAM